MRRHGYLTLICLIGLTLIRFGYAAEASWVEGRWTMSYDPDGARPDILEFLPNGDVINIGPDGNRINGMYVVSDDRVTTVFSQTGKKDIVATFFFDEQHRTLRIVTSKSGKETHYMKLPRASVIPK